MASGKSEPHKTEKTELLDGQAPVSAETAGESKPAHSSYLICFVYGMFMLSVMIFCLSHISVQYLGGAIPENELNAIRFGIGTFMSAAFLATVDRKNWLIALKQWPVFFFVVVFGCLYNGTLYTAAAYAPLGVVGGLSLATAIITNAFLSICVKSERKLCHYISAVIAVTGIILLAQPDFIFHPSSEGKNATTSWVSPCLLEVHPSEDEPELSKGTGMILAVASGIVMAFKYHVMRHMTHTHNPFTVTFWLHVFATILSAILMGIFETPTMPDDLFCIGALILHSVAMAQYILALIFTLSHVSALATNLLASLELPILLISQYTFMKHIMPGKGNWLEISGAVLCFIGSTGGTFAELFWSWYREKAKVKDDNSK